MEKTKLKIEYKPIKDLKPYKNNPRNNDGAVEIVKKSIEEYGFKVPVIIDKNNEIIAGHTRIKAAKELGLEQVPTIQVSDLTPEQIKAFRIMDNKSQEFSFWDEEKLIDEFGQMGDEIINTGFTENEITFLLEKFQVEEEKIISTGYEDTEVNENKYNIQKGDLIWFDKKHKVLCGDSKDAQTYEKLMNDQKIDLVVTSPPYNLNINYGEYKDNKEIREYLQDMQTIFENISEHMNKGRYLCINIGREWGPVNLPAKYDIILEQAGYSFFRNIYWKKPLGSARATTTMRNPFPRYYVPKVQTEVISVYTYDIEKPEILDLMITYKYNEGPRDKEEKIAKKLLNKYAGNVWNIMTETHLTGKHAAPFPIQLPYNCIKFFSKTGENILDPFIGSGTTLLAGEQTNRRVFGVEINPGYCSVIIERYKKLKQDAVIEVLSNDKTRRLV